MLIKINYRTPAKLIVPSNYNWIYTNGDDASTFPVCQYLEEQEYAYIPKAYLVLTKRGRLIIAYPLYFGHEDYNYPYPEDMHWCPISDSPHVIHHNQVFAFKEIDLSEKELKDYFKNKKFHPNCALGRFYKPKA